MNKQDLQLRTKSFHIAIIKLCGNFPRNAAGFETAKQLIRSAGSVGTNYRAACRGSQKLILFIKLRLLLKKQMSLYIGWK